MNDPQTIYRKEDLPVMDFSILFPQTWLKRLVKIFNKPLRYVTNISLLEHYNLLVANDRSSLSSWQKWLNHLKIKVNILNTSLTNIPEIGHFIIVSNHPFGMLDGILLSALVKQKRSDFKIMANQALLPAHGIGKDIIGVDPYEHNHAKKINSKPLRAALHWLTQGGGIAVFPSGDVSRQDKKSKTIIDPPWDPRIAKMILKSKAPVIPVFFYGQNSNLFYRLAAIASRLSTLLLAREFFKKANTTIDLQFGKIITLQEISQFNDPETLIAFLRMKTYDMRLDNYAKT